MVDAVSWPVHLFYFWERSGLWRYERPVFFILGTLLDPLFEGFDLLRCQFAMRIGRRHFFIHIAGCDAIDELTVLKFAGNNGAGAAFQLRA